MATTNLTPRQQEVKDLLDAGKTPAQIAKRLKISESGVYQTMRRMRNGNGSTTQAHSTTGKSSTRKSSTRKGTRRRSPAPTPPPAAEQRTMTPLQAIRARRSELESSVKDAERAHEEASRTATKAAEALAAARSKVSTEVESLNAAEAALTGKAPAAAKPRRQSRGKSGSGRSRSRAKAENGSAPVAQPDETGAQAPQSGAQAAPTPADVGQDPTNGPGGAATLAAHVTGTTPEGAAADADAATATAEEERPGVETLPDFQQGEDGFEEE